ncbi:MAG: radical SAM protein [Promethearchaeota archaeon]
MRKSKIIESKEKTFFIKGRGIPKGCKYCLQGAKAVLFLNGICQKPDHCSWYCPISRERRDMDITFINEVKINSKEDLLEEVYKVDAKGMSITGGEPLLDSNIDKTLNYIKFTKSEFGKKFHIHLYTNGINFNDKIVELLVAAGLDEIRFHPPKDRWSKIEKALDRGISVGAEVPVIPSEDNIKNLEEFVLYLDNIGVSFINLNEFEYCFPNSWSLKARGFTLKEGTIASVVNSNETALNILNKLSSKVSLKIHYCSIRAKDYYQLKNRYIKRAKNIKLPLEVISNEGLLLFAQIEGENEKLNEFYNILLSEFKIKKDLINFTGDIIKIPLYVSINRKITSLIDKFQLKGFIIEMTPFRNPIYQQITEKTPIKLFKKEFGI